MSSLKRYGERGSALVEAAIVLPILLVIIFGIIQYGFVYNSLITLRNASAVAARAAVLGAGQTTTQVCDAARSALNPPLEPASLVCQTTPATLPAAPMTQVTVTLSYPIPIIATYQGLRAGPTWTMTAQTTMQ